MQHILYQVFASELPSIICSKNSYIITGNAAAREKLTHLFEHERLFDYMSPYDVIRFEAAVSANKSVAFDFPLNSYHGYCRARAITQKLSGRTLAAVTLLKGEEETELPKANTEFSLTLSYINEFIREFSDAHKDIDVEDGDGQYLFDIKALMQQLVSDFRRETEYFDCEICYSENKEAEDTECMPSAVGAGNFIRMLTSMMYVMNDITDCRHVDIKLCRYDNVYDIRMTTSVSNPGIAVNDINAFAECFPLSLLRISVCEFIAGQSNCSLNVFSLDCGKRITLSLMTTPEMNIPIDFKSHDQMENYEKLYHEAIRELSGL